jgi:hypothetical protein
MERCKEENLRIKENSGLFSFQIRENAADRTP